MGYGFYNDSGEIVRVKAYYNEGGVIKTEDDLEIVTNLRGEVLTMPKKKDLVLNLTPNFSFAVNSVKGSNYMLDGDPVLRNYDDTPNTVFCTHFPSVGVRDVIPNSNGQRALNTDKGIFLLGKNWNQVNFGFTRPIFNGSNEATVSMTFRSTSHEENGLFWFLDNNSKLGLRGAWSPFRYRVSDNNGGSGDRILFAFNESYVEGGVKNVTITIKGSVITCYHNGEKVTNTLSSPPSLASVQTSCSRIFLNATRDLRGKFCNIGITSLRVWGACLTDDEVRTVFKFDRGYC